MKSLFALKFDVLVNRLNPNVFVSREGKKANIKIVILIITINVRPLFMVITRDTLITIPVSRIGTYTEVLYYS